MITTMNDRKLETCLSRLKGDDFDPFRAVLEQAIAHKVKDLTQALEPADIYRLQGMIKAFQLVLGTVTGDTANGTLVQTQKQNRSTPLMRS